jgi:hypothetical protein
MKPINLKVKMDYLRENLYKNNVLLLHPIIKRGIY